MEAHFFREGKITAPCPSIQLSSIPDEAFTFDIKSTLILNSLNSILMYDKLSEN